MAGVYDEHDEAVKMLIARDLTLNELAKENERLRSADETQRATIKSLSEEIQRLVRKPFPTPGDTLGGGKVLGVIDITDRGGLYSGGEGVGNYWEVYATSGAKPVTAIIVEREGAEDV